MPYTNSTTANNKSEKVEHFYYGDKLKVIDNMDDGEPCEGRMAIDEIVTMKNRSSETTTHIIVEKANGKQVQLEKTRFKLHERAPVGASNGVRFMGNIAQD